MNKYLKIISVSLLAFLLPRALYQGYMILILDNCDPKFGCAGTFQLSLFIAFVFGLISVVSLVSVISLLKKYYISWQAIGSSLFLGSIYNQAILGSEYLHSELSMALTWACISFFVYLGAVWWSKNITKSST